MTLEQWTPADKPKTLNVDQLVLIQKHTDEHTFPTKPPAEFLDLKWVMTQKPTNLDDLLSNLTEEQIIALCRFFTLAEANWTEWHAGDKSPVIYLYKALKTRGALPNKDLVMWIKANTDNRFLPYGNALG